MKSRAAAFDNADSWLRDSAPVLRTAPPGRFLDLACGDGRNSLFLGQLGLQVYGVDASPERIATARRQALDLGSHATFAVQEVDSADFPYGPWAGICVCYFLDRGLFNEIVRHLLPGAVLVYKTHLSHPLRSPHRRPRRSEFLLQPGELLATLRGLVPLRYAEWTDGEGGAYAGLVARRYYSS